MGVATTRLQFPSAVMQILLAQWRSCPFSPLRPARGIVEGYHCETRLSVMAFCAAWRSEISPTAGETRSMVLGASSAQSTSVWAGAKERTRSSAETVVSLTTSQRSERHTFRRASAFLLRVIRLESDDEVIAVTPHCHLPAILHETVPHHLRSNA